VTQARAIAEAGNRQDANRTWWTKFPMEYDWHGTLTLNPGTRAWFEEIDRRFLEAAWFARGSDGSPFGRFIQPALTPGDRVLEVGCGLGTHASLLIRAGARLTAIDLTKPAVDMTRRRFDLFGLDGHLQQADAEELPFPDASFDTVWSWG
jgi:SAM-dependent methyltransferase